MTQYVTRDGDTLDYICWRYYDGRQSGVVEALLEANPELARQGALLQAGTVIELPALIADQPEVETPIKLWD